MKKLLAVLCSCILLLTSFSVLTHADFGDFGGDSDYGDYGGWDDYDYDYDYDDDDDYDYDYDDDDDYDYDRDDDDDDYHYYGGGTSFSSDDDEGHPVLGAIVLAGIILLVVYSKRTKKKGKGGSRPQGATPTAQSTLCDMDSFRSVDPNFSEAAFSEKVSNLYVQFQNAWQNKNMESLRPYLTDAMYTRFDRQLDNYRQNHQTNRVERIAVLDTRLMGWKAEDGLDKIVVRLQTRIVDYVVDDNTGAVVRGSNSTEKFMEYEWIMARTSGLRTGETTGTKAQSCPHCGAPVDINHSAKCEYCDSILTTDSFDWVVSEIKGIAQKTGR